MELFHGSNIEIKDQFVFKTEKSLKTLQFLKGLNV